MTTQPTEQPTLIEAPPTQEPSSTEMPSTEMPSTEMPSTEAPPAEQPTQDGTGQAHDPTGSGYCATPVGQRDEVTPQVRWVDPGALEAGVPLTLQAQFANFSFSPELATQPAQETFCSEPQVANQGHMHGYIINSEKPFGEEQVDCFIVFNQQAESGVAQGNCPNGLPAGTYIATVVAETNSHLQRFKSNPQANPPVHQMMLTVGGADSA